MPNPSYTADKFEYQGQDATLSVARIHPNSWACQIGSELVLLDRDSMMQLRDYLISTVLEKPDKN